MEILLTGIDHLIFVRLVGNDGARTGRAGNVDFRNFHMIDGCVIGGQLGRQGIGLRVDVLGAMMAMMIAATP